MSAAGLKKLKIEHLRGSILPFEIPFEKGKKLTIVYGENGTGKSTICDAFEFLGKGRVGSLENRGLGKTNRYWHSVGKKAADVSVILEKTDASVCRATILKSEVVVNPPGNRPRVEVLRRSQILALLEAKPGDRYAAISRFIDVSGIETSEATLRLAIRDLSSSRDVAVARVQENQDAIRQFWEAAGKPGTGPRAWAENEVTRDPESLDSEVAALDNLQKAYARLGDYPERLRSTKTAHTESKSATAEAEAKAKECIDTIAGDAAEVVGVLESARSYLHKNPTPASCPLCDSSEKVAGLSERITVRLASFSALQLAQENVRKANTALQRADQQLEALREGGKTHAQAFQKTRESFSWPADVKLPPSPTPEDIEDLETWLAATSELPVAWKKSETDRLDKKQFIGTLKRALKTYTENFQAQKDLDVLLPNLKRTLEIVEEERRIFTDKILTNIASEVGRIYELVHPGEGLNKISLELDPNKMLR